VARAVAALPRVILRELTPSEAEFQRRVIALARSLGWLVFHAHSSRHSESGWPDLAMLRERDGRLVLAELKVDTGSRRSSLRPMQLRWLEAARQNPALEWYVWRYTWPGEVMDTITTILTRD
jgi:hypothetical protein